MEGTRLWKVARYGDLIFASYLTDDDGMEWRLFFFTNIHDDGKKGFLFKVESHHTYGWRTCWEKEGTQNTVKKADVPGWQAALKDAAAMAEKYAQDFQNHRKGALYVYAEAAKTRMEHAEAEMKRLVSSYNGEEDALSEIGYAGEYYTKAVTEYDRLRVMYGQAPYTES